jgi:nucleotide-binding universal stress UspA family protein
MTTPASLATTPIAEMALYKRILVALDSSDHANSGMDTAVRLAGMSDDGRITGIHVYAAKLHDVRFRQMEGGLPEQFQEEQELERQRDVHDDLITRGLSVITDSYLDQAERGCHKAGINFNRCSLEGKNYHELAREANSDAYDLLVMGALGLGAVEGSRLGTVCQRVARRASIDTLVIKESNRDLAKGPIVAAVDGSARAYGGLVTALALARHWGVPLKVVAAFDPYFHYVAFNRIAGVLSEEAGKVFRFKEQEKLHEEIIDSGLANIYQGHLAVAETIAKENGMTIETDLLVGKPHDAIAKYLNRVNPSLLTLGKLGVHADPGLDIGGNAEHLLHDVSCAVLLSQRKHNPTVDVVADVTTSWTNEADQRMGLVPPFVRSMARMAILRYAQERGHTVITKKIVEEATAQLCPGHAKQAMAEIVAAHDAGELRRRSNSHPNQERGFESTDWSKQAKSLLLSVEDLSVRNNLRMRAEKKARADGVSIVMEKHIEEFLGSKGSGVRDQSKETNNTVTTEFYWQTAALARLMRVPEGFMRDAGGRHIEDYARQQGVNEITLEVAEAGMGRARQAMEGVRAGDGAHQFTDHRTPVDRCGRKALATGPRGLYPRSLAPAAGGLRKTQGRQPNYP